MSIRADHGEIVALVGVNGAGKSTAINTLVGMLAPDSGSVMTDGVDASTMTETQRLGHFGLLVQEFAIDAEAERQIFTELQRMKHTRITIVVSHRAWTLKDMDRIYVIDGGSVVQEGTYAELVSQRDGRFAEIFAGQAIEPHLSRAAAPR